MEMGREEKNNRNKEGGIEKRIYGGEKQLRRRKNGDGGEGKEKEKKKKRR